MSVLQLHSEPLREAWLDAYGHLNEAYYLVPFSNATWALQDHFGIGVAYFEQSGCAIYTVESHLRYLKEVRAPATFDIQSLILETDAARIRFAHRMLVDGIERATFECMALHYDTASESTAPMPEVVQAALRAVQVSPIPDWAGRSISLQKR